MEWSNETIFEFLNLYETEPALWNTKIGEHKNRHDQFDAWTRIQNKLKGGSFTVKELKKKRDTLMATYRKLRRKTQESEKSGCADEVFKPDWPFYNAMSTFLDDVYNPRKRKYSDDSVDKEDTEDDNENFKAEIEVTNQDCMGLKKIFKRPKSLRKRIKKKQSEKRMDEAYDYFKKMSKNLQKTQDECSLYTELLCKKLRGLQEKTREIAMLEIDRLIFNLKQNETLASNSYTQDASVPVYPSQPFHYNSSPYNATPSPQPSPHCHLFSSSHTSPNYDSIQTVKLEITGVDDTPPSPQQSPKCNSSPSSQSSPNYHTSSSSQTSPNENATLSPMQSPIP